MPLFFSFLVLMVLKKRKLKFRLSEKRTKLEKIFLMILTNQLIYLVNVKTMRKIFQIMCASQKVLTLMCTHDRFSFDLVHYYCKRKEHHLSQYLSMRKIHNVIRINDDWNPPFRFNVCSVKVCKFQKQIFQPKLLPKNEPTNWFFYPDYLSG